MSKIVLWTVSFAFFLSCFGGLTSRHYKSPKKFTGGFNNFELKLKKNGQLELLIETSIAESQNDTGTIWSTRQKRVTGNWTMSNQTIECKLSTSKDSIDKIFKNSAFETFDTSELFRFNAKLDTAYIYGIPCIETNRDEN